MIRFAVFGVTGLVALGAVSALGRSAAPTASAENVPEIVIYPVSASAKTDRLSRFRKENVALANIDPAVVEAQQTTDAAATSSTPLAKAKSKEPTFIARHWHDNTGYVVRKRNAVEANGIQPKPKQACSQDGLSPLLRKLKLKPNCEL